jgi:hypothetical protein
MLPAGGRIVVEVSGDVRYRFSTAGSGPMTQWQVGGGISVGARYETPSVRTEWIESQHMVEGGASFSGSAQFQSFAGLLAGEVSNGRWRAGVYGRYVFTDRIGPFQMRYEGRVHRTFCDSDNGCFNASQDDDSDNQ